jgi:hypothetical protein
MTTTGRFDASRATGALQVEHCDVPDGMTLCEWRRRGGHAAGARDDAAPSTAAGAPGAAKAKRRGLRRAFGRS